MYAETGIMFPYFHNFSQEVQQLEEFCCQQKPINASLGGIPCAPTLQTSTVSDYSFWGGEGDLFKAPEPIIEEPMIGLDPMVAAFSMISSGEDVTTPQSLTMSDIEASIESGRLLSDVFYECRKDLMAKEGNYETPPLSEVLKIETPNDDKLQKSTSSACLRPSFLDFPVVDFGMRRAFSEGDIKTLDNGNKLSQVQSPMGQPKLTSICISEDRREKLSRYWSKKSKRNFDRKIKYACRKALADSQPRLRGRFAKTEVSESCKKQ